jgi:hypothetical protein
MHYKDPRGANWRLPTKSEVTITKELMVCNPTYEADQLRLPFVDEIEDSPHARELIATL